MTTDYYIFRADFLIMLNLDELKTNKNTFLDIKK